MGINLINDNLVAANARFRSVFAPGNYGDAVPIDFASTITFNEGSGFVPQGSGTQVKVLFDGYIRINITVQYTGSPNPLGTLYVTKGGPSIVDSSLVQYSNNRFVIDDIIQVSKNDVLDIRFNGGPIDLLGSGGRDKVVLTRVPDYSAGQPAGFGLASATNYGLVKAPVGFRAVQQVSASHGGSGPVQYLDVSGGTEFDDLGLWDPGTDQYDINASNQGLWIFSAAVEIQNTPNGFGASLTIRKNGTTTVSWANYNNTGGVENLDINGSSIFRLVDGDSIALGCDFAGLYTLLGGDLRTYLCGVRIGL